MPLTDEDKLRIAKSLGLWRPGLYKIKTSEQWEQEQITLQGWHEVTLHGSDLPKRWRKDYANYTVVVIGWELSDDITGHSLAPDWYGPSGSVVFSRFHDPLQIPTSAKPLLCCGARIYYKHSTAFAEMLIRGQRPTDPVLDDEWDKNGNVTHRTVTFNSIDSIQNTQECASESEITKVWRGFNLCKHVLAMRGRPKKVSKQPKFKREYLRTFRKGVKAFIRKRLESSDPDSATRKNVARDQGISQTELGVRLRSCKPPTNFTKLKGQVKKPYRDI